MKMRTTVKDRQSSCRTASNFLRYPIGKSISSDLLWVLPGDGYTYRPRVCLIGARNSGPDDRTAFALELRNDKQQQNRKCRGKNMEISSQQVSQLLKRWSDGDSEALDQLMPLVYDELRRI